MKAACSLFLTVFLLAGCAPPPKEPTLAPPTVDIARAGRGLASLPGAQSVEGEEIRVRYPGEVLFAEGAALPLAGGPRILDPLAAFIAAETGMRWRGTVRAYSGDAEKDQALAAKRAELLARYLAAKGVPPGRIEFVPDPSEGAPLEIALVQSIRDANSSRSKP